MASAARAASASSRAASPLSTSWTIPSPETQITPSYAPRSSEATRSFASSADAVTTSVSRAARRDDRTAIGPDARAIARARPRVDEHEEARRRRRRCGAGDRAAQRVAHLRRLLRRVAPDLQRAQPPLAAAAAAARGARRVVQRERRAVGFDARHVGQRDGGRGLRALTGLRGCTAVGGELQRGGRERHAVGENGSAHARRLGGVGHGVLWRARRVAHMICGGDASARPSFTAAHDSSTRARSSLRRRGLKILRAASSMRAA